MKLLLVFLFLSGCAVISPKNTPVTSAPMPTPATAPLPTPSLSEYLSLSWEKTDAPHPERAAWSNYLNLLIAKDLATYDSAKDITDFCPKYKTLSVQNKVKAIGEMFVGLAYYESGYQTASASVDVGVEGDKNTYSVGLFQVSQIDIRNYKLSNFSNYTFDDLLQALPNIDLALAIMKNRIKKYGVIKTSTGVYWSTLKPGGKYQKIQSIITRVKSKGIGCI